MHTSHARGIIADEDRACAANVVLRGNSRTGEGESKGINVDFLTGENRIQWEICTAKRITDVFVYCRHNSAVPRKSSRDDFQRRFAFRSIENST